MSMFDWFKAVKAPEHRFAWIVAIGVDALQIFAFPLFSPGFASPADTALDLLAAALLTRALGWHWAFLPSFAAELVPGLDLVPTWTAAVFFVTRGKGRTPPGQPPAVDTQVVSSTKTR